MPVSLCGLSTLSPHGGSEKSSVTIDGTGKVWYNDNAFLIGEKHMAGLHAFYCLTEKRFRMKEKQDGCIKY